MGSNADLKKAKSHVNHSEPSVNGDSSHMKQGHSSANGHPSNGVVNGHVTHNGIVHPVSPMTANIQMCYYCFHVLDCQLFGGSVTTPTAFANDAYPLFVTWKIGRDHRLRGCIGTFSPIGLHSGLQEYAITSALHDSRFSPISRDEFPRLHVAVSLLIGFEPAHDWRDWEIGIHGIRIEFLNEKGHHRSATYLPEVAEEQGWSKQEAIDSLLRKGGYRGNITDSYRDSIRLTRYRSEKVAMSHSDYILGKSSITPLY